jgi:hypothetical protein
MDARDTTSGDGLDERELIARIRERLRAPLAEAPLPAAQPRPEAPVDASPEAIDSELAVMAGAADIGNVPLRSYKKLLGPLLTSARNIARKLAAPSLERQVSYNTANHRLTRALRRELEALRSEQEALRRRCDELEAALARANLKADRE